MYGASSLVGFGLVALLVQAAGMSPVTANFLATGVVVAAGFAGHKWISFGGKKA